MISCIMPTNASRRLFIPFAIAYFIRQNYPSKELIIVDDSLVSNHDLIPVADNIHYLHLPQGFSTLGSKRNYACSLAQGEIIFHWDDDDWYAPDWLSKQSEYMRQNDIDICGLKNLYFYNPKELTCWMYQYGYNFRPWVAGATLSYKHEVWKSYPFKEMNVGEDNDFAWNSGARVASSQYTNGFVSILHGNNTSPKYTQDSQWKQEPIAIVNDILRDDFLKYT